MKGKTLVIVKTILFRATFILINLITARLWFEDWHVTPYQILMMISMTLTYFWFESVWEKQVRKGYSASWMDLGKIMFQLVFYGFAIGTGIILLKPTINHLLGI